ncbi:sensor histidine kinase [Nocardioides pocheonensis]|uniref:Uncharacterized protein n=1 Tax=Nocardioides pocheonensis TaxID=661485 RepID=A0A3N0GJP7_9ACTN|nr:ATP-binding protein [Nocardioides pocheonensis]RNM12673.1 hypothetical protein EFL26_18900 [Nocardioides pocheonensis]
MVQFVLRSVAALLIVALATFFEARSMSERTAIQDARIHGDAIARIIAAPMVNAAVRAHDPEATKAFDNLMRERVLGSSIVHAKLWTVGGTVIWSDEAALVGRSFTFDKSVRRQAGRSFVHAEVSHLSDSENTLEKDNGELLEVYVGTKDADGVPMIFETYWSAGRLHADQQHLLGLIAPLSLGGLLLLLLLIVPLGVVLARTSTRSISERNRMLNHALSAAELERRRVSQLLHDRVIQDLAALGYALPSTAGQLNDSPEGDDARAVIERATEVVREDATALRTMLVDIYPPSVAIGLAPAIHELAAKAEESGVAVSVEIHRAEQLPLESTQLAYRIVREGLLNVVKHAGATRAEVTVDVHDQVVDVSVRDNGSARASAAIADQDSGHYGLRLLHDAVVDLGGTLGVYSRAVGGTLLVGSFPVALMATP